MKKKKVVIELCEHRRTYEGRLLGLIDDREFSAVLEKKRYQNKLFSSETTPLNSIVSNHSRLNGMRLALAIRKIDGKVVGGKHLFITERLDFVGSQGGNEAGILGYQDEYYLLTEEDEDHE